MIKNLTWIFVANIFASFSKWLMVILIAHNLNATEVGIYSLAFALGAPITMLADMKLRSLYVTDSNAELNNYRGIRNMFSIVAIIILSIIALFFYRTYLIIIILVGISKVLDLQSDLYYSVPHKKGDLKLVGKILLSKQVILFIGFASSLYITKNLIFAILFQVVTQIIYLFIVERRIILKEYRVTLGKADWKNIKIIVGLGLPLGLVQMLQSINSFLPRYILEYFESPEVLGYFSAIMYIVMISSLFLNAIGQVFLPELAKHYKLLEIEEFKRKLYIHLTVISILIGMITVLISILFGETILFYLYGPEYSVFKDVLTIIAITVSINLISGNFNTALMAMRYISIQPKITLINLLSTIIISYLFVSNYGIIGASYSILISAFLQLILRVYFVNRKLNIGRTNK